MKHLLTTMLILVIAGIAQAQTQVGFTAGIGGTTQSCIGDIYNNDDILTGFNAGIILRKPVSETFALKTNLLYALKGRSFDVEENNKIINSKDKLNYLTLPVEAEYSIPVSKNRLFVAVGPYAGVLLDAKREMKNTSVDLNDEIKNFDFGFAFELGFSKKCLSNNELQLSVRYDAGLTKIADYDEDLRNKALTINIGFLL